MMKKPRLPCPGAGPVHDAASNNPDTDGNGTWKQNTSSINSTSGPRSRIPLKGCGPPPSDFFNSVCRQTPMSCRGRCTNSKRMRGVIVGRDAAGSNGLAHDPSELMSGERKGIGMHQEWAIPQRPKRQVLTRITDWAGAWVPPLQASERGSPLCSWSVIEYLMEMTTSVGERDTSSSAKPL